MPTYSFDFVVYGGDPWAVCAAFSAKKVRPSMSVALVVDYPSLTPQQQSQCGFSSPDRLGGISTVGGQTTWDDTTLGKLIEGTYKFGMLQYTQRYYAPDYLADRLRVLLQQAGVTVFYGYHVSSVSYINNSNGRREITSVTFRPIRYGTTSGYYIEWDPTRENLTLRASFYADCSVDGRLTRGALYGINPWSYGRYDWPTSVLPDAEEPYMYAVAQAMTLCVRLSGFPVTPNSDSKDIQWETHNGHYGGIYGRNAFLSTTSKLAALNRTLFAETNMKIFMGPSNWAQEYPSRNVVWATGPHIVNVIAGDYEKDRGTPLSPRSNLYMSPSGLTVDQGYFMLRDELLRGRYIEALRADLGLKDLTLLAVAPHPYIRESFHIAKAASSIAHGTESSNYVITPEHVIQSGASGTDGKDGWAYYERIGVAFYGIDHHGYRFTDHYDPNTGTFYWRPDVERRLRPDLVNKYGRWWMTPKYGFYVPFRALVSRYCANLLLAGYATQCSNIAWGALRVAPNLCILGDGAGAAVAVVMNKGYNRDLFTLIGNSSFETDLRNTLANVVAANLNLKTP